MNPDVLAAGLSHGVAQKWMKDEGVVTSGYFCRAEGPIPEVHGSSGSRSFRLGLTQPGRAALRGDLPFFWTLYLPDGFFISILQMGLRCSVLEEVYRKPGIAVAHMTISNAKPTPVFPSPAQSLLRNTYHKSWSFLVSNPISDTQTTCFYNCPKRLQQPPGASPLATPTPILPLDKEASQLSFSKGAFRQEGSSGPGISS